MPATALAGRRCRGNASVVLALIAGPVVPAARWLAIVVLARDVPVLRIAVRRALAAAFRAVLDSAIGALVHLGDPNAAATG